MTTQPGAWRDWILFFLRGVAEQAQDALFRAKRLQDLQATWRQRLAESLFAPPALTIPQAQRLLGVTYPSAQRNVQGLVEAGILQRLGESSYAKTFVATEILQIIGER